MNAMKDMDGRGWSCSCRMLLCFFVATNTAIAAIGTNVQETDASGVSTSNWSIHMATSEPSANPSPMNSAKLSFRCNTNFAIEAPTKTWVARYASARSAKVSGTS